MKLGEYIKYKRGNRFSQRDLAKICDISVSYLCELESGQKSASEEVIKRLAEGLELNEDETREFILMAAFEKSPEIIREEFVAKTKEIAGLKKILSGVSDNLSSGYFAPVYESVSAGTGKCVYGDAIDFLPVPENIKKSGSIVYFKVSGDSMEPEIKNGSYVLIKEDIMPEQGQEGVFALEDEWFVKTFRKVGDTIILSSINRSYKDIEISDSEAVNFRCIGKVAGVFNFVK